MLQVVSNRIYVVGAPDMRQLDMQLHRCDANPVPGDTNHNYCGGTSCRRLQRVWERHRFQVALRMLRIAVERERLPDFELRLCLDDTCAVCFFSFRGILLRVMPSATLQVPPCVRGVATAGVMGYGSSHLAHVRSSRWPLASTRPLFQ